MRAYSFGRLKKDSQQKQCLSEALNSGGMDLMCPPKIHEEVVTPVVMVMVFGGGVFGR